MIALKIIGIIVLILVATIFIGIMATIVGTILAVNQEEEIEINNE